MNKFSYRLCYGDSMTVEDWIMEVLFDNEETEQGTKKVVDTVTRDTNFTRADVVSGLFQLEYEGRIYQVFPDEWKINQGWA